MSFSPPLVNQADATLVKKRRTYSFNRSDSMSSDTKENGLRLPSPKEPRAAVLPMPPPTRRDSLRRTDVEDSGISESRSEDSDGEDIVLIEKACSASMAEEEKQPTTRKSEGLLALGFQIFFPFLIAGCGMMLAGMLLDAVQVSPGPSSGIRLSLVYMYVHTQSCSHVALERVYGRGRAVHPSASPAGIEG